MNYLLPKRGILSMHASANEGKDLGIWLSVVVVVLLSFGRCMVVAA